MKPLQIREFSIWELINAIQNRRRILVLNTLIAGVVGLFIAFCIPKTYVSSVAIVPESSDGNGQLSGGVSALASMAGISLGGSVDAIGPELYPKVVASNEFIVNLLSSQVSTFDGSVSTDYLDYTRNHTRRPWWGWIKVLLGKLMKKINPQPVFTISDPSQTGINPHRMSREDEELVESVRSTVECSMDIKTGVIDIAFSAQDPLVAKTMVDTIARHLQHFITDYRTEKARTDLVYYQQLEVELNEEYQRSQSAYAKYCDSHQGNLLQAYQSEMERLENDMQLAMNAYSQVKQQVQMAEAKVQEKTPAFTIVEGASVPNRHASPRKMLMILGWMFLGFVGTLAWIYVRLLFSKQD